MWNAAVVYMRCIVGVVASVLGNARVGCIGQICEVAKDEQALMKY